MNRNQKGYTLIELMLVITILALITSITTPYVNIILTKAYQSKTKSSLGSLRTAINIYYSDNEGHWPWATEPEFSTVALSDALVPKNIDRVPVPLLKDTLGSFNGLDLNFDQEATTLMAMGQEVYIYHGDQDYIAALNSPYVYNNQQGRLFIANGNYDSSGGYFYQW